MSPRKFYITTAIDYVNARIPASPIDGMGPTDTILAPVWPNTEGSSPE